MARVILGREKPLREWDAARGRARRGDVSTIPRGGVTRCCDAGAVGRRGGHLARIVQ